MADEHFAATGTFDRKLETAEGGIFTATPLPIAPALAAPARALRAPGIGEHNSLLAELPVQIEKTT